MTTKFYDRLSNDLTQLLENPIDYNVKIEVGEEPASQIFEVHSYILQSRSPYFKKKFNESPFNESHVKDLKMPNISTKVFNVIIKYIYGGTISLEKLENSDIFDILITSRELDLDELVEYLQTHLSTNNASWLRLNFAHVYQTSFLKNFEIIQKFCNNIIAKHPDTIFESENFNSLPEDVLISIIRLDDLQLEEDKIWDYVIQWGKDKIRIYQQILMNGQQVFNKLYPYQQLFEPKLWLDINAKFLAPNNPISSTILPPRNTFDIIQKFCNNIIAKHPDTIFESENFNSLPEDVLISIIRLDDLQLEEDKIWDYVIQWGKDKIRIYQQILMNGQQVFNKLYPYQQLFEPKLWLDINAKFLAPNNPISSTILPPRNTFDVTLPTRTTTPISSNIITDEHALEISSWIDRKETPYTENNPYGFKLLVRGSKDGFDVKTILEICDKVSNTVIVLKVEGTGEIIGGYNPLEIYNNNIYGQWYYSEDSFAFSLKTENLKNSIVSRVTNFDQAIFYCSGYSYFQFGRILWLRGNLKTGKESRCHTEHYEKKIRSNADGFSVEEFEVFKVSPKK
ncbi:hypothetical protein Glove_37g111 [Diversispora epigaea]|uniref:BTB domain-containing protein n=1 Tax=Diversispora epigaea TaxID=1348612 RepID=A0A397JGC1_9GLOM|nr:hypothetical protein Glove_37g111 [Diversispora epigaea]